MDKTYRCRVEKSCKHSKHACGKIRGTATRYFFIKSAIELFNCHEKTQEGKWKDILLVLSLFKDICNTKTLFPTDLRDTSAMAVSPKYGVLYEKPEERQSTFINSA